MAIIVTYACRAAIASRRRSRDRRWVRHGDMDILENVERGHIVLSLDLTRARSVHRSRLPPSRGELLALIVRTIMGRLDKFPGGKRSSGFHERAGDPA